MKQEVNSNSGIGVYTTPKIEVIEIELTQNILQPSGDFGVNPMQEGGDWLS